MTKHNSSTSILQPLNSNDRYVDGKEISLIISISAGTLKNMRYQKKGPPYMKSGGIVRYHVQRTLDWMEEKEVQPESFYG